MATVITPRLSRVITFVRAELLSYDPSGAAVTAINDDYHRMLSNDTPEINISEAMLQGLLHCLALEEFESKIKEIISDFQGTRH